MKNLVQMSILLTMFLFPLNLMAKESTLILKVKETTGKSISFSLKRDQIIHLDIENSLNESIISEKILGTNTIKRTYNLSKLNNGIYFLLISNAEKFTRFKITVKNKSVTLDEKPISEIYRVRFQKILNKLKITIPNINKPVKFSIFNNENGKLLYETTEEVLNGKVSKKFNFANKYNDSEIKGRNYIIKIEYEYGVVYKPLFAE